ncbi:hypothetical protein [Nitrospira sp. Kam-Ns4a]
MTQARFPPRDWQTWTRQCHFLAACAAAAWLAACQPNDQPFKSEVETLRKQLAKQESVIASLQDGSKVMQQQIDLLNRELREAKKETERVEAERKALAEKLATQAAENRKLAADVQRVASQRARAEENLRVEDKGGQVEEIAKPMAAVCKAAEQVLAKHGYALKVAMKTEQKAVYLTERKVTAPASLEVSGVRNQYLLFLQTLPSRATRLSVKAEFEKLTAGGARAAGAEETAEIERRLIGEIAKALGAPGKT